MKVLSTESSLAYALGMMCKPFKARRDSEERRRSAVALVKYLLALKEPEVRLSRPYRELLSILVWKISLAESTKYKTRFRSERACKGRVSLRHDHVFQRSKMVTSLMKAKGHKVDVLLKKAFGCTVTIKEHVRLSKFDKKFNGWARYRRAGIKVINTETGERVSWAST